MSATSQARSGRDAGGSSPRVRRALLVAGVVTLFVLRASDTFVSDHATGDQRSFLGLAMKMDRSGFEGYNLDHVSRRDIAGGLEYVWSPEKDGKLLEAFRSEGIGFFGQPVFHAPPLLPFLLMLSHRALAPRRGYPVLFPGAARRMALAERLETQLYTSLVPLAFGAVFIVATFLLGRMMSGFGAGVIAALLVAISPAVLFASERLWQDVPLAAFTTLSMLFLLRFSRSGDSASFVMAAIAYALAALTKSTALLLAPIVVIAIALRSTRPGGRADGRLRWTAARAGLFFLLFLGLTFPWFYTAWRTWGTPLYNAGEEGISKVHPWWIFLKSRPWYTYVVSIVAMVPLYGLGYYRIVRVIMRRAWPEDLMLAIWFLLFLVAMTLVTRYSEQLGPDSRYMLPAYPALAILTASQIVRLGNALEKRASPAVARWAIAGALIASFVWSYRLSDPSYAKFPEIYDHFMNMPF